MKDKLKSILTKIKNNKKKVIGITFGVFAVFIFTFAVYNLNNPTYFNRLFANVLNNDYSVSKSKESNKGKIEITNNKFMLNIKKKDIIENTTEFQSSKTIRLNVKILVVFLVSFNVIFVSVLYLIKKDKNEKN